MDNDSEPKATRARSAGRVLLRLVFPLQAMRQTVSLAKRDAMRSRANMALIAELGAQAKRALSGREEAQGDSTQPTSQDAPQRVVRLAPRGGASPVDGEPAREGVAKQAPRDDTFARAMARRGQGAPTVAELRQRFLLKKRTAIAADVVFSCLAITQVVVAVALGGRHTAIVLGVLSLVGCQSICFVNALAAQLRIWQLDTRRLSKAERGGLRDFMQEVPRWWLQTLNPELSRQTKEVS